MKVFIILMLIIFCSSCLTTTISHTSGNMKTVIEMETPEGIKYYILDDEFSGYINEYGELIPVKK